MRLLGVDFGRKRIGLAIGTDDPMVTTAKPNLNPSGTLRIDAENIARLARDWEADAVVLGIPLNDQDPSMARICGMLAEHLRAQGLIVHEVDESLTSVEAERNLAATGWTVARRNKLRDGEAARLILERYLGQA